MEIVTTEEFKNLLHATQIEINWRDASVGLNCIDLLTIFSAFHEHAC